MTEYTELATLQGQEDGVLSLGFSARGKYIAATGYAGVCIWEVAQQQRVSVPAPPAVITDKHIYTRSVWLHFEHTGLHVLVLGSKRGDISLWRWKRAFVYSCRSKHSPDVTEVLSMDVYRRSVHHEERGRVAVSTADGRITLWSVCPSADKLRQIFSVQLEPAFFPKTIKFDVSAHAIVAFAETGGTMARYHCDTGKHMGHRHDGPEVMASVAIDAAKSVFAAYTGSTYEFSSLRRQMHIATIDSETPDIYYPMSMAFAEGGELLLVGTDKAHALLYDVEHGRIRQSFGYPKGGLVQQVAACSTKDCHLVAFAGSSIRRSADVIIYVKARSRKILHWAFTVAILCLALHNLANLTVCSALY
ncbi:WD40-repeat-containing domain protein [Schizophyllum amplum]|uniref:WD40-repeat-containing domain protein n=1 Tax=Schizophyllum amplum TaxID=97359 RepID=A0A550C4K2_9AGAR|nr:WD40-repeat-containing domain protein [Auriculariopsis ampla]